MKEGKRERRSVVAKKLDDREKEQGADVGAYHVNTCSGVFQQSGGEGRCYFAPGVRRGQRLPVWYADHSALIIEPLST